MFAAPVALMLAVLMTLGLPILPPRHLSTDAWPIDALPAEHERRLDAQVRAELIDQLAISPDVLAELRGHPVSIDPWRNLGGLGA